MSVISTLLNMYESLRFKLHHDYLSLQPLSSQLTPTSISLLQVPSTLLQPPSA